MVMLNQLGHAVAALHAAGYVHCDLKPHNLLVDETGHLRLIDLGQTCPVGTIKTRIQGTPEYMAPEQLRCLSVSFKTDVFGFGATAYKLLTGVSLPTLFTTGRKTNSFLLDDTIRPPIALAPHVPQELSDLVMACVKTAADKRPTLTEALARLAEIQRDYRAASDSVAEQAVSSIEI
jgi:serine/threonine protein kinase